MYIVLTSSYCEIPAGVFYYSRKYKDYLYEGC